MSSRVSGGSSASATPALGPSASGSSPSDASGASTPTPVATLKRGGSIADLQERSCGPKRHALEAYCLSFEDELSDSQDEELDILDLTGVDVDEDARFVARQIADNYRERQQQHQVRSSVAGGAAPASDDNPVTSTSAEYDGNFDLGPPQGPNVLETRSPSKSVSANLPPQLPAPFSLVQPFPAPSGLSGPSVPPSPSLRQVSGIPPQTSASAAAGPSMAAPSAPQMPPSGLLTGPTNLPPGALRGGTLANVIGRTALFDYVTGRDEFGEALPDRLLDYLQDEHFDLNGPPVSNKELDDLLSNIRPDLEFADKDVDNTPQGLKQPLYRHQSVAVAWMKKMEEGSNKGGILADDMGLGKTISTIALMLSRPNTSSTSRTKTNLIIAPLSLVRQWEEEISKKTRSSHRLSILVYHNKKADIDELLKYDVVLTTYGTMAAEFGRWSDFQSRNKGRLIDYSDPSIRYKFPLLHPGKAKFYRVILDEAQCIKNKNTKTAMGCHELAAIHRWCLTGTPMMNGVVELFSLLKFLRIKPYNHWSHFRDAFKALIKKTGHSKHAAMHKLRALLKAVMMRRKKDSQIDGKLILQLPEKTETVVYAELSKDERDFYDQLEKKSQVQFSKYLRDNSIGQNYSQVLVLLLRMRQACCHPHLNLDVQDSIASLLPEEEMIELVRQLDKAIITRIKGLQAFECPICYDFVSCPSFFGKCGHMSCAQCLIRLVDSARMENLQEGQESDTAKCPVCRDPFNPQKCFTWDVFQKAHMPEKLEPAEADPESSEDFGYDWSDGGSDFDDDASDASDADEKGNLKDFIVDDDEDSDYEPTHTTTSKKRKGKGKATKVDIKPSMLKILRKEATRSRESYLRYMTYLRQKWLPSAKVSECIKLIQQAAEDGEKIIVFSQWTLLLDLIQVGLKHEKFRGDLRRYDGSMTGEERFESAREFRDKKKITVMLVSLHAGNAGLNLTAASRVVIMDPFWNPYVERQAVDRAHRIGQHKQVTVYRILTKDTVEDRIVALQEKKREMVEAALDEAEGIKISRLGVQQLKFLFNTT